MTRGRFRTTCIVLTVIAVCIVPLIAHPSAPRTASELIGLWEAERDFGPALSGPLDLVRDDQGWYAQIAGFSAPALISDSGLVFHFAGDKGAFRIAFDTSRDTLTGYWIQPPTKANFVRFASPVHLVLTSADHWRGEVSPADDRMTFYLSLSARGDGTIGGFLRNPQANFGRFFTIANVTLADNIVRIVEPNRDIPRLQGPYYPEDDRFSIYIPDAGGTFDFHRVPDDGSSHFQARAGLDSPYTYHPPEVRADGWPVAHLQDVGMAAGPIADLIQLIIDTEADSISAPYIHAVLIARHGKLVVEEYFHGYTADTPHDTRSASKSLTTTLAGLAIQAGEPVSVSSPVYEIMYAGHPPDDLDPRKTRIRLEHLMTMTAGLACDDSDPESPGNEDRMQNQEDEPNWWQYTLELPSLHEPGEAVTYCSASPNLVGGVLQHATGTWLPILYERYFAAPLGITHYQINLMPTGDAYGGGGVHIRGRDFLKVAQLYLDDGVWQGQRLLSTQWVHDALTPYKHMYDQGYGYGWWILELPYKDRTVTAFYAGGNGGQYAMGIPELDLAIVMFGGNYGQRTTHLPKQLHIPEYILKSILLD